MASWHQDCHGTCQQRQHRYAPAVNRRAGRSLQREVAAPEAMAAKAASARQGSRPHDVQVLTAGAGGQRGVRFAAGPGLRAGHGRAWLRPDHLRGLCTKVVVKPIANAPTRLNAVETGQVSYAFEMPDSTVTPPRPVKEKLLYATLMSQKRPSWIRYITRPRYEGVILSITCGGVFSSATGHHLSNVVVSHAREAG